MILGRAVKWFASNQAARVSKRFPLTLQRGVSPLKSTAGECKWCYHRCHSRFAVASSHPVESPKQPPQYLTQHGISLRAADTKILKKPNKSAHFALKTKSRCALQILYK